MNYFKTIWALTKAYVKRLFRDKVAMFFTFLFPLMFLLVFGLLYSRGGSTFHIALLNESNTDFSKLFVSEIEKNNSIKINTAITNFNDAKLRMGRGEIDSVLEIPPDFGKLNKSGVPTGKVNVYYEAGNPQAGQTFAAYMNGVFSEINQMVTKATLPLGVETKSTATENLRPFDYVFAGLLGFTMLSLGVFGMANNFPAEKKTGSFRRMRVAPMRVSQLIFANGITYIFTGLLSAFLMYIAAVVIFKFHMRGDYLSLIIFSILGIITMFGFGIAIGGWAKNENQSAPLSNLVAFPLMFLSGVFFPRYLMPEWLQGITNYFPLSPIIDGLRMITAEGRNLFEVGHQLLIMGIWAVVIYAIAIFVFQWD